MLVIPSVKFYFEYKVRTIIFRNKNKLIQNSLICVPLDGTVAEDVVAANLDKIERSDICNLCATGGIRAKVAGNRLTSDFISDSNSSS